MCLRSAGALIALLSLAVQPLPLDSDPHPATNRPPTCWSQGLADSTLCSSPHLTPHFKRPKPTTVDRELPLTFEVNRGQAEAHVKFLARGNGYIAFLTPTEVVLSMHVIHPRRVDVLNLPEDSPSAIRHRNSALVRMRFAGANPTFEIDGREELPGKVNYFTGHDPREWRTGIPTYLKVRYKNLYPGVDLVCHGSMQRLEYDFLVAPGADPGAIKPPAISPSPAGTGLPKTSGPSSIRHIRLESVC